MGGCVRSSSVHMVVVIVRPCGPTQRWTWVNRSVRSASSFAERSIKSAGEMPGGMHSSSSRGATCPRTARIPSASLFLDPMGACYLGHALMGELERARRRSSAPVSSGTMAMDQREVAGIQSAGFESAPGPMSSPIEGHLAGLHARSGVLDERQVACSRKSTGPSRTCSGMSRRCRRTCKTSSPRWRSNMQPITF